MEDFGMLENINLLSIIVRTLLSVIIGGALGLERGRKNHPAGFRTYILVCFGATLVMMTNQYIFETFQTGDISRLGAQVISGIGFLGAGTIIITGRNQVKGLTTAAGLWAAACVGLAIGIGFYKGAIIGGITVLCVMTILHKMDQLMREKSKQLDLYLEFNSPGGIGAFINLAKENNIGISDLQIINNEIYGEKALTVLLSIEIKRNQTHAQVLQILECAEGLSCIEEL
jgi:putative Mg2+ transporter-C (MgtC) family protein